MVRVRDRVSVRVRVTYSSNMKDVAKGLDSSSDLNLRVTVVTCPPSFLPAHTYIVTLHTQQCMYVSASKSWVPEAYLER